MKRIREDMAFDRLSQHDCYVYHDEALYGHAYQYAGFSPKNTLYYHLLPAID